MLGSFRVTWFPRVCRGVRGDSGSKPPPRRLYGSAAPGRRLSCSHRSPPWPWGCPFQLVPRWVRAGVIPVLTDTRWEAVGWPWCPSCSCWVWRCPPEGLSTPAAQPLLWSCGGDLGALRPPCQAFRAIPDNGWVVDLVRPALKVGDGGCLARVCWGPWQGWTGRGGVVGKGISVWHLAQAGQTLGHMKLCFCSFTFRWKGSLVSWMLLRKADELSGRGPRGLWTQAGWGQVLAASPAGVQVRVLLPKPQGYD